MTVTSHRLGSVWMRQPEAVIDALKAFVIHRRFVKQQNVLQNRNRARIVLENVLDPHNAAACIRTSECMGIQDIHVIESLSPQVVDDSVSAGAYKWVDIRRHGHAHECIESLKAEGYAIWASHLSPAAQPLEHVRPDPGDNRPVAFVFGNETRGISRAMQANADRCFILPMVGATQSYNVTVSVAMTLYHARQAGLLALPLTTKHQSQVLARWLCRDVTASRAILERAGIDCSDY